MADPERPEANEPVDVDPIDDPLTDHEYDGILEYDNPTPSWWNWLFVLSIVFSVFYFAYFHLGAGPSVEKKHEWAFAANLELQYGELGELPNEPATLLDLMSSDKWSRAGKAIYDKNCVNCHGVLASGVSAPNLTDDRFIHVKKITDIVRVISKGAANGSMPAWEGQLIHEEIMLVSAYVASLRGIDRPTAGWSGNAGEPIDPWPEPGAASSPTPPADD